MGHEVTVITGASGGVGRAVARDFARRGHRLVLLARGQKGLDAAVTEAAAHGAAATGMTVDMADPDAVQSVVDRIEAEHGPIGLWINVAFTSVFARFEHIAPAEFRRVTEVTYLGYVYATMAVLRHMKGRNRGTIVQVGSTLAYRGIPLQTAYCGAKHAIQGFHESLRCELLHEGSAVRVTMVQLPAVNTPQFSWVLSRLPNKAQPVPPIYQPEVIARGIAYAAAHPKRREYWIGESTVATLLVNAVAPGLLDRYLARTGFGAQQTPHPKPEDQPANLWTPADGPEGHDFGAHGDFDDRSYGHSPQQWLSHHLGAVAAGTTAVAAAAVTIRWLRR
jgi:NAD(P)-dependent dehydrogenase (short-subunit alcohol dehydrogenase family)